MIVIVWDNGWVFEPVTVTWVNWYELKVQDSVAVPEPVTVPGVIVQEVLLVDKDTAPVNPSRGEMEIVDDPDAPAFSVRLVGLAEILKSGGGTVSITKVNSLIDPLVTVTFSMYAPTGTEMATLIVAVEVLDPAAGKDKLVGENETVGS